MLDNFFCLQSFCFSENFKNRQIFIDRSKMIQLLGRRLELLVNFRLVK